MNKSKIMLADSDTSIVIPNKSLGARVKSGLVYMEKHSTITITYHAFQSRIPLQGLEPPYPWLPESFLESMVVNKDII
jgi:hypothetical protein